MGFRGLGFRIQGLLREVKPFQCLVGNGGMKKGETTLFRVLVGSEGPERNGTDCIVQGLESRAWLEMGYGETKLGDCYGFRA